MDEDRVYAVEVSWVLVTGEANGIGLAVTKDESEDEGAEKGGENSMAGCCERAYDHHSCKRRVIRKCLGGGCNGKARTMQGSQCGWGSVVME